jgi:hypothetical protein
MRAIPLRTPSFVCAGRFERISFFIQIIPKQSKVAGSRQVKAILRTSSATLCHLAQKGRQVGGIGIVRGHMRLPSPWGEHCRVSLPPATHGKAADDDDRVASVRICTTAYFRIEARNYIAARALSSSLPINRRYSLSAPHSSHPPCAPEPCGR